MPVDLSEKALKFLEGTCIFCQPWWLQAVSPDHWGVAVVEKGGEIAAVWPYTYKMRLGRFRIQDLPIFFSYSGPWLRASNARYAKRLSDENRLIAELVEKFPPFASFRQWLHPSVTNWLPLYWKGYKQTTRYTYIIDCNEGLGAIWDETKANIRTDIRKAEKKLEVIEDESIERFLALQHSTYSHQGMSLPYPEEMLIRLDAECSRRGVRKILLAVDSENRVHAGIYLVWDNATVYAILRGSDPAFRTSGAASLVAWKAIEFAAAEGKEFDFAGSWVESIERFVRAFGARQTPLFEVSKVDSKIVQSYRNLWKWTHRRGQSE